MVNVFGNPVTNATLEAMPEFEGEDHNPCGPSRGGAGEDPGGEQGGKRPSVPGQAQEQLRQRRLHQVPHLQRHRRDTAVHQVPRLARSHRSAALPGLYRKRPVGRLLPRQDQRCSLRVLGRRRVPYTGGRRVARPGHHDRVGHRLGASEYQQRLRRDPSVRPVHRQPVHYDRE